jgi:hypothetical protein
LCFLSCNISVSEDTLDKDILQDKLQVYRTQLDSFRDEFGGIYQLPDVSFYLFGMGNRDKYLYKNGELRNCKTGIVEKFWDFTIEIIVPNAYAVYGITKTSIEVIIHEDQDGIWILDTRGKTRINKQNSKVILPSFDDHRYSEILKVLHQEILANIVDSKPLPNLFVYNKPWRRDAAMMAMCLDLTGNLDLIRDWVLSLEEPYDYNNGKKQGHPEAEADNLGQTLYLLSLFTDKKNITVERVLKEIPRWLVEDNGAKYIKGRSDFQEVPVYQTKWLIYGLDKLEIVHDYSIPDIPDNYSSLFWWAYKEYHKKGNEWTDEKYPYIGWARDHFYNTANGLISNRDYPLTWESNASQANYEGMQMISSEFSEKKISVPHTWHSAEVFLYLYDMNYKNR